MKKYLWIFLILGLIIGIAIFTFNNNNNNNEQDGYVAERTGMDYSGIMQEENQNTVNQIENKEEDIKEVLAEFYTKIPKETEARDDNIKLACKTLNGLTVKAGEIFSLWEVLGCPTKETGYEKAKTFTSNGEVTQSYGGGICQLSTTIYNAVLKVDGLKVTERHEHSRKVPYIEDGKDASVSYNTADLKFKNTLDYDIQIEAKVEDNKVKIKLIRI